MSSPAALRPRGRTRPLAPWLLVLAYLVLITAWVGANPPGAAPDEPAHYIKALGAGGGDLVGTPTPPGLEDEAQGLSAETPRQRAWQEKTSRLVEVPPSLSAPPELDCNAHLTEVSSACRSSGQPPPQPSVQPTYVGTYQPYLYLAPGWAARLAANVDDAMLLARAVSAALVIVLLALAVLASWEPEVGTASLLGLLLALSPMVIFLASAVSASGAEVAGGVCYLAALLRLTRRAPPTPATWLGLALGGAVLSLSRSLGPAWVVLGAMVLPLALGVPRSVAVLRDGGRRALVAGGVIGLAVGVSLGWELTHQVHPETDIATVLDGIVLAVGELPDIYRQQVGVFGWLDTELPIEGYLAWSVGLAVVVVLAVVLGTARQRMVLAVLTLASAGLSVAVSAGLIRPTGFGMQARYVMPLTVVVPLFAADIVRSQWARARSRVTTGLLWLAVGAVAGVQFVAWYANARRQAVGTAGPKLFLEVAEWAPRLGWLPWMVLALMGSALLVLAMAVAWWGDGNSWPWPGRGRHLSAPVVSLPNARPTT